MRGGMQNSGEIEQLTAMGFSENDAKAAIGASGGELEGAVNWLLAGNTAPLVPGGGGGGGAASPWAGGGGGGAALPVGGRAAGPQAGETHASLEAVFISTRYYHD